MLRNSILACFFFLFGNLASAQIQFQNGDVIFQTSLSNQANAIILATGSKLSHIGVIEVTNRGDIFVIEAIGKVSRTPLNNWIQRGKGGRYEVYRYPQLGGKSLNIVQAAKSYLGRSYDIYFSSDNFEIYCSELVELAFRGSGLSIGQWQKVKELNLNHSKVQKLVEARWKGHPRCRGVGTFKECWPRILDAELVSPASIAADSRLIRIFSNY